MKVKNITFDELRGVKELGIVVMGAGGNLMDWAKGFIEIWRNENEKIIKNERKVFKLVAKLTGNKLGDKGRIDLVLLFDPKCKIDIGKLAIWRIKMGGISWIEDFVVNYRKDYI